MQTIPVGTQTRTTVRAQIAELQSLLDQAISIEDHICSGSSSNEKASPPTCSDLILAAIEGELDLAVGKATRIVSRLTEIENRL